MQNNLVAKPAAMETNYAITPRGEWTDPTEDILKNNAKNKKTIAFSQGSEIGHQEKLESVVSGRFIVTEHKVIEQTSSSRDPEENLQSSELDIIDSDDEGGPPKNASQRKRLLWLQQRRGSFLYVECVECEQWRLINCKDPVEVPKKWVCRMNSDKRYNSCDIPQEAVNIKPGEEIIHTIYTAGSLVWAKVTGYPWWPAMVSDCPETMIYYWLENPGDKIPSHYMVAFFDSKRVTRRWVQVHKLISFKHNPDHDKKYKIEMKYRERLAFSKQQANDALLLDIPERLRKYSFVSRWRYRIGKPGSFSKNIIEMIYKNDSRGNSQLQRANIFHNFPNTTTQKRFKKDELIVVDDSDSESAPIYQIENIVAENHNEFTNNDSYSNNATAGSLAEIDQSAMVTESTNKSTKINEQDLAKNDSNREYSQELQESSTVSQITGTLGSLAGTDQLPIVTESPNNTTSINEQDPSKHESNRDKKNTEKRRKGFAIKPKIRKNVTETDNEIIYKDPCRSTGALGSLVGIDQAPVITESQMQDPAKYNYKRKRPNEFQELEEILFKAGKRNKLTKIKHKEKSHEASSAEPKIRKNGSETYNEVSLNDTCNSIGILGSLTGIDSPYMVTESLNNNTTFREQDSNNERSDEFQESEERKKHVPEASNEFTNNPCSSSGTLGSIAGIDQPPMCTESPNNREHDPATHGSNRRRSRKLQKSKETLTENYAETRHEAASTQRKIKKTAGLLPEIKQSTTLTKPSTDISKIRCKSDSARVDLHELQLSETSSKQVANREEQHDATSRKSEFRKNCPPKVPCSSIETQSTETSQSVVDINKQSNTLPNNVQMYKVERLEVKKSKTKYLEKEESEIKDMIEEMLQKMHVGDKKRKIRKVNEEQSQIQTVNKKKLNIMNAKTSEMTHVGEENSEPQKTDLDILKATNMNNRPEINNTESKRLQKNNVDIKKEDVEDSDTENVDTKNTEINSLDNRTKFANKEHLKTLFRKYRILNKILPEKQLLKVIVREVQLFLKIQKILEERKRIKRLQRRNNNKIRNAVDKQAEIKIEPKVKYEVDCADENCATQVMENESEEIRLQESTSSESTKENSEPTNDNLLSVELKQRNSASSESYNKFIESLHRDADLFLSQLIRSNADVDENSNNCESEDVLNEIVENRSPSSNISSPLLLDQDSDSDSQEMHLCVSEDEGSC